MVDWIQSSELFTYWGLFLNLSMHETIFSHLTSIKLAKLM